MTVHTPDNNENILEADEENDGSNDVSSDAQETDSCNFINPGPNFDVLKVF